MSDFVAKLAAAQHRIHGRVVDFSGDIPKRHFDGADATALASVSAKLFDLAKDFVELQRVLADDARLFRKRA